MTIYRPRPGRTLWKHLGGDISIVTVHALGSFDTDDEDRVEPVNLEDLGGCWVESPDGNRFEVDGCISTAPRVVEATSQPPFGEWERVREWDIPEPDPW